VAVCRLAPVRSWIASQLPPASAAREPATIHRLSPLDISGVDGRARFRGLSISYRGFCRWHNFGGERHSPLPGYPSSARERDLNGDPGPLRAKERPASQRDGPVAQVGQSGGFLIREGERSWAHRPPPREDSRSA